MRRERTPSTTRPRARTSGSPCPSPAPRWTPARRFRSLATGFPDCTLFPGTCDAVLRQSGRRTDAARGPRGRGAQNYFSTSSRPWLGNVAATSFARLGGTFTRFGTGSLLGRRRGEVPGALRIVVPGGELRVSQAGEAESVLLTVSTHATGACVWSVLRERVHRPSPATRRRTLADARAPCPSVRKVRRACASERILRALPEPPGCSISARSTEPVPSGTAALLPAECPAGTDAPRERRLRQPCPLTSGSDLDSMHREAARSPSRYASSSPALISNALLIRAVLDQHAAENAVRSRVPRSGSLSALQHGESMSRKSRAFSVASAYPRLLATPAICESPRLMGEPARHRCPRNFAALGRRPGVERDDSLREQSR